MSLINEDDRKQYDAFVTGLLVDLGCFSYDPETIIWHYAKGAALVGIIENKTLYATHVDCLNDSTEIRYAQNLFREALSDLREKNKEDKAAYTLLNTYLRIGDEKFTPPSPFFVSCFSQRRDDLSQWRAYSEQGGENGYAIGFIARDLHDVRGKILRVNYDRTKHKKAAASLAAATLEFFLKGLQKKPAPGISEWTMEFLVEWDDCTAQLAPVLKDDCFEAEDEVRLIHQQNSLDTVRFQQKTTLLARYLELSFPSKLPIAEVLVGPGRQQNVTRVNVEKLLRQEGYETTRVQLSRMPLQRP